MANLIKWWAVPTLHNFREGMTMKIFILVSVVIFAVSFTINPLMSAEQTYLKSKSDDGSVLILGDGSVWEISSVDQIDSNLWLPMSTIIIPDSEDSLINADDGEKVDAQRIR